MGLQKFQNIMQQQQMSIFIGSAVFKVGITQGITLCYGGVEGLFGYMNFALLFLVVMEFLGLWSTIFYDIAMVKFLRDRSRTAPIQVAVWTIEPQRSFLRNILNDSVPIKSTIFSIISIVFILVASWFLLFVDPNDDYGANQIVTILGAAIAGSHMVCTLVFTIKSQDAKINSVQPFSFVIKRRI